MPDSTATGTAARVYKRVVPRPVRSAAATHVPPRVRRGVKTRLARSLARVEEVRHQRALRQLRDTAVPGLADRRTTTADGRMAHVSNGLTAGIARRLDHDLVTHALNTAAIPWFAVPALDDRRIALAVAQEHKSAVRRVVRALLEERTGYVVSVSPSDASQATTPGSHVKAWRHYGKARVIRLVWLRTDPTGSLRFGDDQGVEIEFWRTDTTLAEPRLVGPRPNRVQRVTAVRGAHVEVPFNRFTGYAPDERQQLPTLTRPGFDAPRVEEVAFPVDAVVLVRHSGQWAQDLLRATLRSLHQYAPWISTLHVVTSVPVPSWVREGGALRVTEAGPDAEHHLQQLPGLADHFLLLRPGALLGRPVRAFDFFTPQGGTRPRRGPWTAAEAESPWARLAFEASGRTTGHGYAAGPQPYTRTLLQQLAAVVPHLPDVDAQSADGIPGTHPLDGLHHHFGRCEGVADPSGEASVTLHASAPHLDRWLTRLLARRDAQVLQLTGLGCPQARSQGGTAAMTRFLHGYFPVASPFETDPLRLTEARR
jgi:hypothetical protein